MYEKNTILETKNIMCNDIARKKILDSSELAQMVCTNFILKGKTQIDPLIKEISVSFFREHFLIKVLFRP